MKSDKESP